MRVIDWNISYMGNYIPKLDFLFSHLENDYCVFLQEVKPTVYEYIKSKYSENNTLLYSLNYRKPGKFDSDARKLGALIILSKEIQILESGVIERNLFPDRTMYATINYNNKILKLLAIHSITGCGYYKAKSVQYESLAEFVDTYSPDIIGIDANEPQIDSYDIEKMIFFDNGNGAKIFFNTIKQKCLVDTFVKFSDIKNDNSLPLTVSHCIKRKGNVRYDFLFSNNDFKIKSCEYKYNEAIAAGSDHALIVADFLI